MATSHGLMGMRSPLPSKPSAQYGLIQGLDKSAAAKYGIVVLPAQHKQGLSAAGATRPAVAVRCCTVEASLEASSSKRAHVMKQRKAFLKAHHALTYIRSSSCIRESCVCMHAD